VVNFVVVAVIELSSLMVVVVVTMTMMMKEGRQ
jgi:hypothetical protein